MNEEQENKVAENEEVNIDIEMAKKALQFLEAKKEAMSQQQMRISSLGGVKNE